MDDSNTKPLPPSGTEAGLPQSDATGIPSGAAQPPAKIPRRLVWAMMGPNGIRAGWRLLLFILIGVICSSVLARLSSVFGLRPSRGTHPLSVAFGEGMIFLAFLFAALVMARIEKRSLADYALPLREAFRASFWLGAFLGFLALTALLLAIKLAHGFDFGSVALGGAEMVQYAAFWAVAFLLVGFSEEFLFRGYALYTLSTGIGFWPAALLLSGLFGAVHLQNPGEAWVGALAAAFVGVFFSFTVRRTGSLWFAIGLHAAWDYTESFLYSVPDSGAMVTGHLLNSSFHGPRWLTGGSVGPEGSALVFVIITAMIIVCNLMYRDVRFPAIAKGPGSFGSSLQAPHFQEPTPDNVQKTSDL